MSTPGPGTPPQPPLPGEEDPPGPSPSAEDDGPGAPDDTDYDTPGTVTKPQLTKIAVVFQKMGFTNDERDQRLKAASQVIRREIDTGNDLSFSEAKVLIDTLERCGTREKLIALLATGEDGGA